MNDMNDMKIQRLYNRIGMIECKLCSLNKRMEALTRELKESVSKYDTDSIITFVPGYVRHIEELHREIKALEEQKRMLDWIAKEEQ